MSLMGPPSGKTDVGQTVASFKDYPSAQKAVSSLIADGVPARDIAIVGAGLRSIERVTGKLGYARAAWSGAMNGVLIGLLFSAIFVLGNPAAPVAMFFGVLLVGVALGMLLSLISFTIVRRRRDYASVMQVVADHYEISVQAGSFHRARQVLAPSAPQRTTVVRPSPSAPPQYGERIGEARDTGRPQYGERLPAPPVPGSDESATPADAERQDAEPQDADGADAARAGADGTEAGRPDDGDRSPRP